MKRSISKCVITSIACLLAIASGCGQQRNTYPVQGMVRFPDGKILQDGTVEFELTGSSNPVTSTGTIGPDGIFTLGTHQLDDGALPGRHRVVVISDHVIGTGAERPGLIPESPVHPKYREFRTSGLIHEVKRESNYIVIDVEYSPNVETSAEKQAEDQPL